MNMDTHTSMKKNVPTIDDKPTNASSKSNLKNKNYLQCDETIETDEHNLQSTFDNKSENGDSEDELENDFESTEAAKAEDEARPEWITNMTSPVSDYELALLQNEIENDSENFYESQTFQASTSYITADQVRNYSEKFLLTNIPLEWSIHELRRLIEEAVGMPLQFKMFVILEKVLPDSGIGYWLCKFKDRVAGQAARERLSKATIKGKPLAVEPYRMDLPKLQLTTEDKEELFKMRKILRFKAKAEKNGETNTNNNIKSNEIMDGVGVNVMKKFGLGLSSRRLFINGFPENVALAKLQSVFCLAGKILYMEKIARSAAKVEYDHPIEAAQAISMFNGQLFCGHLLSVKPDRFQDSVRTLPPGLKTIGKGFGTGGRPLENVRFSMEIKELKKQVSLLTKLIQKETNVDLAKVTPNSNRDAQNIPKIGPSQEIPFQPPMWQTNNTNTNVQIRPKHKINLFQNQSNIQPVQTVQPGPQATRPTMYQPNDPNQCPGFQGFQGNQYGPNEPTVQYPMTNEMFQFMAFSAGMNQSTTPTSYQQNVPCDQMPGPSNSIPGYGNQDQNSYVHPQDQNSYVHPQDQNSYVHPQDQNSYVHPQDQNSYVHPQDQNSYVHPQDQNSYVRPQAQNIVVPQQFDQYPRSIPETSPVVQPSTANKSERKMDWRTNTPQNERESSFVSKEMNDSYRENIIKDDGKYERSTKKYDNDRYEKRPSKSYEKRKRNYSSSSDNEDRDYSKTKKNKPQSKTLIFKHLPLNVSQKILMDKMRTVGEVKLVERIDGVRTLVRFERAKDAERCIKLFDQSKVDGKTVRVSFF